MVQPDGKILIGGGFSTLSPNGGATVTRNRIARLNPDGTLDTAFDPNANSDVNAIALQTDGKILVGGFFNGANSIGGEARNRIARLDATTGAADSFDPNASGGVFAIAVQADGKILAGGDFNGANSIGGEARNRIARLDATTGAADSFNPNANFGVFTIAVQADGKILAGGDFNGANSIGGATRNRIARLDATTGLADSFDPNANVGASMYAIAVQADGKILAGGNFSTLAPNGGAAVTRNNIARLETDGRLDRTLNLDTVGNVVAATAVQPDGKILVGGFFTTMLGVARNNIARLNADGTLDAAFNPNPNSGVNAIAVQADGKILVGGFFTSIGGATRNRIARLDATTGLADSFDPDANATVDSIAVQADGKILASGDFTSIGEQTRSRIARLDPVTGLADSFDPNANSGVFAIAVQADGKVLAGGSFTSIGGQPRNFIARLDAATGLADSFNPNADHLVLTIALQADGKILAGGDFTSIGGQPRNFIARLNATTGLADSFNPNASSRVTAIAVQADGKISVGGGFTTMGLQQRNFIARLDAATGLADSFDPNADNGVLAIAVQADGKILAGGQFNNIGGQGRKLIARLSNDTAALQNVAVTQSAITWTRGGSSPQLTRVTFESSTDNVNYDLLGNGTVAGSNWTLTDLDLPIGQNIYIRARGSYASGYENGSESIQESVRNAFIAEPPPAPTTLGNISTRLRVETGDNVLIGGFIITGTESKRVMVRAIGPSLTDFGVVGVLADPTLELHHTDDMGNDVILASSDNWMDAPNRQEIIDSTLAPTNDLESAILLSLDPGLYTGIVRGVNNTTGIALVEAYDLDLAADSILANISTRGLVQTGDDVMIGGFIILGTDPQEVLVRAIGPSLPLAGTLADPTLELHNADGSLLASNDNWRSDQEADIIATTIPPTDDAESAILATLTPDAYTAIVRGTNQTIGIALVEVFALD